MARQESGGEWRGETNAEWKPPQDERRNEPQDGRRDRDDRPQRPDSRDSRASKESRNSREDVKQHAGEYQKTESWADASLEEEKKKSGEYYRGGGQHDDRGRHAPGPITREKLEAAELRGGEIKRNLTQLRRGNAGPALVVSDRKQDSKQADSQV